MQEQHDPFQVGGSITPASKSCNFVTIADVEEEVS